LLQWTRPAFYRHTALTRETLSPAWLTAAAAIAGVSVWVGLFAYKHVPYTDELWWHFVWRGDAPRFLRASFAAAVLIGATALWRLFGPARAQPQPDEHGVFEIVPMLHRATRTDANLALTGDKRFLISRSRDAFLMYQVQGRTWAVMGDPIGAQRACADLLWELREQSHRQQGRLLLYEISEQILPVAIELGLQLGKFGEEALVDLSAFSLEGPAMKSLRHSVRRAIREGASFDLIPAAQVPGVIPDLRRISDEWLAAKRRSEKAFSVGRFDPDHLCRFDCAVVRCHGGITAFANVWTTSARQELSVDLMRHSEEAPYGAMDFLFASLMQWGKEQGYRRFSLGLAPLSGLEDRRLAPLWVKAGALVFRHGEGLFGFEGLRAYKDKFEPRWEPRYIAGPHGIGMAAALIDLETLIGGGPRSAAARWHLNPKGVPQDGRVDVAPPIASALP
jgi:phosphatidylglycerol lysyltransferase